MSDASHTPSSLDFDRWADAALVVELFAVSPSSLGGLILRSELSPAREIVSEWISDALPSSTPLLRVPSHITDENLLGGVSIAASMRSGRLIAERGLLARADGGVVVLTTAERVRAEVSASLCSALDRGEIPAQGDVARGAVPCRIGVVALDEGIDDERTPEGLADRLAFRLDLTGMRHDPATSARPSLRRIEPARRRFADVSMAPEFLEPLTVAAMSIGVSSLRAVVLASVAARAHAALRGSVLVGEEDVVAVARLVLGPRATSLPAESVPGARDEPNDALSDDGEPDKRSEQDTSDEGSASRGPDRALEEVVVEAAKSGVPAGVLELLSSARSARTARATDGHAGEARASTLRGRPAGTRAALPQTGERLNLVETLRAAAPWQRLRSRERAQDVAAKGPRVLIRKEDFRVSKFQQRSETCVIFCVDASGSLALRRLGEAKGAVEQVLADCYVRRDHVALIAFRGASASVVLPPTRSLARVRRGLAELAGGGTTPLAAGIEAAFMLSLATRKSGRTPLLVLMTDGRANVARDGSSGGAVPAAEAVASARSVRAARIRALFLDTAPRPRPEARNLAREMAARYIHLPYVDAVGISRQVQALRWAP